VNFMTKALLMLTVGRGVPDMLAVKYLKPDITLILTTEQGLNSAKHLQNLVKLRFGCKLEILPTTHPYNEYEIKRACRDALEQFSHAEWVMNITSSPKIISIFAMDVAREQNIPCWFLNTDGGEVISLAKTLPIEHQAVFDVTVEEYMDVYQRQHEKRETIEYREKAESWYPTAQVLVQYPQITHQLLRKLRKAQEGKKQNESLSLKFGINAKPLIQELASSKSSFLVIDKETSDTLDCTISGGEKRKFLCGDWLEVFVCKEVEKAGFAQDYQWGYKVYHEKDIYELDLALTSRGLLFIGECKTDNDPFTKNSEYLDTIDANAGLLGRAYVSKFFITNHPNPLSVSSYQTFQQQAAQKKIRIINADELPNIGEILKQEVIKPTYPRI